MGNGKVWTTEGRVTTRINGRIVTINSIGDLILSSCLSVVLSNYNIGSMFLRIILHLFFSFC